MSELLKRYEESQKPRVQDAKQIPALATNFFDQTSQFAEGFTPFMTKGVSKLTERAMQYHNEELKGIIIPDGFQPTEAGITLNRWTPAKKYYNPGQR